MRKGELLVLIATAATLGSGVVNLASVIGPSLPARHAILREIFPLEFLHVARSITLLIGFSLVIASVHIYRRKRRGFLLVMGLSAGSILFHLTKGIDYEEATVSLILMGLLWTARKEFVVKSGLPEWRSALIQFAAAFLFALAYGVAGFWFLEPRQFGIDFNVVDSIHRTLRFLLLAGDAQLTPHTPYARWFLNSLYIISVTAIAYSGLVLFRPVLYRFRTHPQECALAKGIVERHGRAATDYFKTWPDKSFFFLPDRQCFVAYRVGASFAVALGDPVGPEESIEKAVRSFQSFCKENDWGFGFHQALPDFLPIYLKLGLKKMKIGDEAIVDLTAFTLEGKKAKEIRNKANQFEKLGVKIGRYKPPIPDDVMAQLKEVSDDWLRIPGRRERQFTLGKFDYAYVRSTAVLTAEDAQNRFLGFVNMVPSYHRGEATLDLMRRRSDAPNGVMDYVLYKSFQIAKEQGFQRFNLGLAPMSGFQEKEEASAQERAVHAFFQQLNFLFSYKGLRSYKAKFASFWEPRYVIYRNALDLPRLALALSKISEIEE